MARMPELDEAANVGEIHAAVAKVAEPTSRLRRLRLSALFLFMDFLQSYCDDAIIVRYSSLFWLFPQDAVSGRTLAVFRRNNLIAQAFRSWKAGHNGLSRRAVLRHGRPHCALTRFPNSDN